jgi:hypothetical protein
MDEIAGDCAEAPALVELAQTCRAVGEWMAGDASLDDRLAGSVPFCTMAAVAVAGWQLLRQSRHVLEAGGVQARTKPVVARWFTEHLVPEALGLKAAATGGAALLYALGAEELASA